MPEETMVGEERFGIVVDGIVMPGHNSLSQAQEAIDNNSQLKAKGAVATPLSASVKKGTYKSGDKPWD